jgi:DNA-binding GntR family transcriptional regulator
MLPHLSLGAAADHHRDIFQAIRDHDPVRARKEMEIHLKWALKVQLRDQAEEENV